MMSWTNLHRGREAGARSTPYAEPGKFSTAIGAWQKITIYCVVKSGKVENLTPMA
jgi:hypothetical protein